MEITGKRAMVVGGASGMARATAEALREAGAEVAILDLPKSAGAEVAAGMGATFHPCDVMDAASVDAAFESALGALGSLHIAVNTAGGGTAMRTISKNGPHPLDEFRRVIELSLVATFNLNRLQAWQMSQNELDGEERGVIIDTASVAAFEGQIGQVAYTAAKAGVAAMMLPMARDLGSLGHPVGRDRAEPVRDRHDVARAAGDAGRAHPRQRVPAPHGQARGVRAARARDRAQPDAQRQLHPPRRRRALRPEVARASRRVGAVPQA